MNTVRFNQLVESRLEEIKYLLTSKGKEYAVPDAQGGDRLAHFKIAATLLNSTPIEALWGMWVKHIVSLTTMVQDGTTATAKLDKWKEKTGDIIGYALLFEALLQESEEEPKSEKMV